MRRFRSFGSHLNPCINALHGRAVCTLSLKCAILWMYEITEVFVTATSRPPGIKSHTCRHPPATSVKEKQVIFA